MSLRRLGHSLLYEAKMAYYDEINTEHCPSCNSKIQGINANGSVSDDSRCPSCDTPLKRVRIEVASFNDAPYAIDTIEIDYCRLRDRE